MRTKDREKLAEVHDLSRKELILRAKEFSKKFRIKDGKDFKLKDYDPKEDDGLGSADKPLAKKTLDLGVEALSSMQEVLYAQDRWAVLLIFQTMDAAGKDGAIRHVMSERRPDSLAIRHRHFHRTISVHSGKRSGCFFLRIIGNKTNYRDS